MKVAIMELCRVCDKGMYLIWGEMRLPTESHSCKGHGYFKEQSEN